ncbi:hypothetical protein NSQ82_04335 [Caldifermentibacillus hisashii]|nr:hypothetical protein [Caldibacillus sp. 210928-DFI.2.22]
MLFLIVTPPSDIIGIHTINVLCYCRSMITQLRISSLYQQKMSLLIGKIFSAQTNRESVVIAITRKPPIIATQLFILS